MPRHKRFKPRRGLHRLCQWSCCRDRAARLSSPESRRQRQAQRRGACGGARRENGAGTRASCAPVRRVHARTTAIAIAKSPPNLYECTESTCLYGARAPMCTWDARTFLLVLTAMWRRRVPPSHSAKYRSTRQLLLRGRAPKQSVADKHQQSGAHFTSGGPQNHCSAGVGVRCGPPHHPRPPPAWPWTPPGLWDHSGGGGEAPWPTCGAPWLLLPIELDPTPCYIWVPGGRPV